jgi:hypothetical protein
MRPKGQNASQDISYVTLPSNVMSKSYKDSLSIRTTNLTKQRLPLPSESYEPAKLTLDFRRTETRKSVIFAYSDNLGFVSPCIIIHSNKSNNQMHQSLRFIARRLNTAQQFRASSCPLSGAYKLQ